MDSGIPGSVAVIVAHPDDETLWSGGTILMHPDRQWFILCLCRGSDLNRAPRFFNALAALRSEGAMGDLDDGPGQNPLDEKEVEDAILQLLPPEHFDLIISHNPSGEYTRHVRHEETGKAVIRLWSEGKIPASELWTFAYGDANKAHLPKAEEKASIYQPLTKQIWLQKYRIITEIYGFHQNSFEAETTPRMEAFWQFTKPADAERWLNHGGHSQ